MTQPPVRELLSSYLMKRQDTIMQRLLTLIAQSPDLAQVNDIAHTREYQQSGATMLQLLAHNIADPRDRRCFHYARQRIQDRVRQNIPATQLLRLITAQRQIFVKLLQFQFEDEPALLNLMTEIVDGQVRELEIICAEAYQTVRDQQWTVSETKYYSLFESASEAIVSFRPGEGQIIEANMQAERLLGRPRTELLGTSFVELFAPEHREQVRWLVEQREGSNNIRLEDMAVSRAGFPGGDGLVVPISLSCNWINVDGDSVAQVIMRDVTQMRQMQHELQNYAEQLEERVASRTRELRESEERYRALFLQEQRRGRHLSLINDVQKCALAAGDVATFLHQATSAIQTHFHKSDATFYVCDTLRDSVIEPQPTSFKEDDTSNTLTGDAASPASADSPTGTPPATPGDDECGDLVAVAQAGNHGLSVSECGRQPSDLGLAGYVAQSGETIYLARDVTSDARYARPPDVYRDPGSQMCVPVLIDDQVIGVISVQSEDPDTFDAPDVVALQTVATIASSHVQSSRMFREMRELSEFNRTLITTMLHSLMVVDQQGHIKLINERLRQTLRVEKENLVDQPMERVLGQSVVESSHLHDIVRDVTQNGTPHILPEVHVWQSDASFVFELRLSRVYFRGEAQCVILLINLTVRWRKTQQMQLMNEVGRLFQGSLDVNTVLYTVLTCITAGAALGFNRAFLLLRDEGSDSLSGTMALGPSSQEEASRIWQELSQRPLSLKEILDHAALSEALRLTPLQERVLTLRVNLKNPCFAALSQAMDERHTVCTKREELIRTGLWDHNPEFRRECEVAAALWTAHEMAVAPLVAKERVVGIVLADNLYSGTPIEVEDIQMLDTLAQQAGLTVENALTYQALQKAQKELVSAERLVAVGEMAARVSHEIRNPLSTIGGFARNILKKPDNPASVESKSKIIVEEVARLEELLTDLLEMARPRPLDLQLHAVNDLIEHALLLANSDVQAMGVSIEKQLAPDLPLLLCDRRRLLQALLNTIRNGAQAMPDGGVLTLVSRVLHRPERQSLIQIEVCDTGVGISQKALKQVFDPFFSTKVSGSGLGLAITRRIIEDHGGTIDVYSDEDKGPGTAFVFSLPLRDPPENSPTTE